MQFMFNTDNNIDGTEAVAERIETGIRGTLSRFEDQLTRVVLHVNQETDEHYTASLEARIEGQQPQAVTADGGSVDGVAMEAGEKMERLLTSHFGKLNDRRPEPDTIG
ncbi:HPF/RaiA family ribosome-associated protein [Sphingomicrobium aestuariivivum]|uniref:HPF/RaiA family ribosome-associated protein n=1 Tax=Sphingomicrobium aestuariivivum TaxID=1582356 RepID=UPI001FD67FFB|nr:HPF/RaiA family ribosome-associated protein [Sphingomicrobium aestuariivivum]MCJ8191068.1 HPF/RaiA family ribosome-associated protein [Sphingomicrobium aestuariivivum]